MKVQVIPGVQYRDAEAGIAWLKKALQFREHAIYRDETGNVVHGEMLFGDGIIMLGTAGLKNESAAWTVLPEACGNKVTGSTYLVIEDCGPLWDSATAAGAEVLLSLRTMDYGGKAFTVRDPEGHVWSVGEYDPFAVQPTGA